MRHGYQLHEFWRVRSLFFDCRQFSKLTENLICIKYFIFSYTSASNKFGFNTYFIASGCAQANEDFLSLCRVFYCCCPSISKFVTGRQILVKFSTVVFQEASCSGPVGVAPLQTDGRSYFIGICL